MKREAIDWKLIILAIVVLVVLGFLFNSNLFKSGETNLSPFERQLSDRSGVSLGGWGDRCDVPYQDCGPGLTCCENSFRSDGAAFCVDTDDDEYHCGGCNNECEDAGDGGGGLCIDGVCL